MELASKYDPQAVESKWYQYWLDNKLFSSKHDGQERGRGHLQGPCPAEPGPGRIIIFNLNNVWIYLNCLFPPTRRSFDKFCCKSILTRG